jgi:TetR/AcrR family transcriptional repressor of nem operon
MREEIVDAALAQFHEKGFNAAAVKDITDRAGVPKGSFYNHFPRYGEQRRLTDLADPGVPPVERIRKHFEFLRDDVLDHGITRGCLLGNFGTEIVDHSDPIRTAVHEGLVKWSDLLAAAIAEGQEAGEIRGDLPADQAARYLLSAWEGTLIQARADKSQAPFEVFFALTFGSLLKA